MRGAIPISSLPRRTDAAGVDGLNAAIERSQLFMEAGADMAKPMGVDTIDDIKRVMREVGGPHMATLSQAAGMKQRSLEDLEAAGVVAATFPSLALFAAAQAVRNVLRILKRENSLTPTFEHCCRSTIITDWSGSRSSWRARKATTGPLRPSSTSGLRNSRRTSVQTGVERAPKKKGAGTKPALPPYNAVRHYPLVTTGGGALPLPV